MGIGFGQRENLTNRIGRILDGYPFDRGILKELMQNADDAGATKLHFILDERPLPTDNCVYHITDVPTFLTSLNNEKVLCAFDPLCNHVVCATDGKPGYMLKGLDELRGTYPHVFEEYLERIYGDGEGTLFRFPLRQAASQISRNVPTIISIRDLFSKFEDCMHECLLFVKNLKEIVLKCIDKKTGEDNFIFSARASLSRKALERYNNFNCRG